MREWVTILPGLRRRAPPKSGEDAVEDRLVANTDVVLAKALIHLGPGSRGWIGFDNYVSIFATRETYLPPSEWDPEVHRAVAEFAVAYDCAVRVMDLERSVYFVKGVIDTTPISSRAATR
jgi:hypothetical protein